MALEPAGGSAPVQTGLAAPGEAIEQQHQAAGVRDADRLQASGLHLAGLRCPPPGRLGGGDRPFPQGGERKAPYEAVLGRAKLAAMSAATATTPSTIACAVCRPELCVDRTLMAPTK